MKKAALLGMYAVVLYFVLRRYYEQEAQVGAPNPSAITAPTYLYAILAITSDFLGSFPVILGAGLTFAFIWQTQSASKTTTKTTPKKTTTKAG